MTYGADVRVRDHSSRNFLHIAVRFGGKLGQFFRKKNSLEVRQTGTIFFFLKAGAEEYRIHTELPGSCHAVDTVSKMVALIFVMDSDDDVTVVVSATRTRAKQNERRDHSRTSWACGLLKVYALILEIAMH